MKTLEDFTSMIQKTGTLEFIQNPYNIFHKFYYNDADESSESSMDIDFDRVQGGSVKVVVVNKSDFQRFDAFIDKLESCNLIELKIIEDFSEFEDDAIDADNLNLEDTITLLDDYIDNIHTDLDRKRLKDVVKGLYVEAKNI